jgi:signal transduction histidine kinase/HPt (histidine-containing phosphotransfer) domain-containing protein/ActR/RegA family two-component response regulator
MTASFPVTLLLIVNGALAVTLATFAWHRRRVAGARPFMAMNVVAAMVSWAYAAHFQSQSDLLRDFWMRVGLTGQGILPTCALAMCLSLSGRREWTSGARLRLLLVAPTLWVIVLWTNPWHQLLVRGGFGSPTLIRPFALWGDPGPVFWIFAGYVAVATLMGVILLLDYGLRRGGIGRAQVLAVMVALTVPFVAQFASFATGVAGRYPVGPFAYSITLPILAFAVFRLGFLDLVPIARAVVFDALHEGVLVFDGAGRVVDGNAAAARLLGIGAGVVGKDAAVVLAAWPDVLTLVDERRGGRVTIGSGTLVLEASVTQLPADSPGILLMLHDVTDTRRAEAKAEAAARARADFLARMSHEVRTPMNGVIGLSGLLLKTGGLDERQRAYAEGVRESGQSLLRVVNDVLDFSRIDAGRLELEAAEFEPRACIAQVVDLIRPEAQIKGLAITVTIEADVPFTVVGDAGRLRQILINLLGNAVKFTPNGGVGVYAAIAGGDDDQVMLRITVTDTGIGIAPAALARIFEPFEQADQTMARRFGGSGLGLAICRQLVELMGGRIEAVSEPARGSEFTFTIRVARAAMPERAPAAAAGDVRRWSGRVLVAEDHSVNQIVIASLLEQRGLVADVAATGIEAVTLCSQVAYDLVLMDCRMPEMDGFEATREIRRRQSGGRHTPIVALTADALPASRERCFAAGMDAFLTKPLREMELNEVLGRWLQPVPDSHLPESDAPLHEAREIMGDRFGAVAAQYLDDARRSVQAMRAALTRGDIDALADLAHRLKGSSGMIGATAVERVCHRIEADAAAAGNLLAELEGALTRVGDTFSAVEEPRR